MAKRLIAFINSKGGVSKSTTCRVYVEALREAGQKPLLVDCDGTVGHLFRYFGVRDEKTGEYLFPQPKDRGVRTFEIVGKAEDRVELGAVLDEGHETIVIDFPATAVTLLEQVEENYGFFALAHEMGYAVTMVIPITTEPASMFSVSDCAELDPLADLVVVRNKFFGEKFLAWDGLEGLPVASGKSILEQRGGHDISLPELDGDTMGAISAFGLTFHQAQSTTSPLIISRRSQVHRWLDAVRTEFAKVGDVLGLGVADRKRGAA